MHYHGDLTLFWTGTQTMRTWHSYRNICFWISLTLPYRTGFLIYVGQIDDFLKTFSINDPPFRALEDWKLETIEGRNTLFYRGRNYILDDLNLQRDILQMMHDHKTAGHPGEAKTLVSVEWHYWWPGLCTFIQSYVRGCGKCRQYKINRSPSHPSYVPIAALTVTQPFAHCSMDLITNLPHSNGFDSW